MKVTDLPAAQPTFLMTYLNFATSSAALASGVEPVVDLRLTRGAHLVVRALDAQTHLAEVLVIWSRRSA